MKIDELQKKLAYLKTLEAKVSELFWVVGSYEREQTDLVEKDSFSNETNTLYNKIISSRQQLEFILSL